MRICQHVAFDASGRGYPCDREATTKHNGEWLCDFCYGLTACAEGLCSDECPAHGTRSLEEGRR